MFWLIVAVVFWGFLHSFNASFGVKEFFRRMIGEWFMKYYRLGYNAVAVITFMPILISLFLQPGEVLYRVPAPWGYMMMAGQAFFAAGLLVAVFQFGILYFIGLRQLVQKPGERQLVTSGLYSYVRHPFYTFFLSMLWLTPTMTSSLLAVYLGLTLYIRIGIHFEERKLLREFGDGYARYSASTPALLPLPKFIWGACLSRRGANSQTPDNA